MGCQENADNDLPQQSDIIVFYVFFETNVVTFIKCRTDYTLAESLAKVRANQEFGRPLSWSHGNEW